MKVIESDELKIKKVHKLLDTPKKIMTINCKIRLNCSWWITLEDIYVLDKLRELSLRAVISTFQQVNL